MKYIALKKLGIDAAAMQARLSEGTVTKAEFDAEIRDQGVELVYRTIIEQVVKVVPQGGLDYQEMRKHLRILAALDDAVAVLALEDTDHELLVRLVKGHRWGAVDDNIVTFVEDMVNASAQDPRTLAEAAE